MDKLTLTPGVFLKELLVARNMSLLGLAETSGLSIDSLEGVRDGQVPITIEIAEKLGKGFGVRPVAWLSLQESLDVETKTAKKRVL
jgi:plasmid maintenance system antidote protein VapI